MKKIFAALFLSIFIFSLAIVPVFAESNKLFGQARNGSKAAERKAELEEKKQERQDEVMENLKTRAEKEINRRIESLKKLITRINEFKKLSSAQKSSLTTQIQTEIDSLTALLAKIQADTDIETLRADVKSIVSSYRIYALFLPKIRIMGAADRMLNVSDQMSSHAATLETKINEAEENGSDVTELNALLSDMKAGIADAKVQAQGAIDAVSPLTPDGFPGNKTTLQSARQMVVTALKDLNEARQDARKIIVGLLKLNKDTTPTVTTTP